LNDHLGPRNCIGEIFARREMLIHSTMFAKQLRLVYEGEERPPELEAAVNLRSQHDFVMVPKIKRRRMTRQDAATVGRIPSSG
jgi:cytochrome P450